MSTFKEHKSVADRSAADRERHKTKIEKAKSKLAIAKQKTKASKAKLDQTIFEIKGS